MKVHGDAAGFRPTESSKAAVYVRASSVCLQLGKETTQCTRDGGGGMQGWSENFSAIRRLCLRPFASNIRYTSLGKWRRVSFPGGA